MREIRPAFAFFVPRGAPRKSARYFLPRSLDQSPLALLSASAGLLERHLLESRHLVMLRLRLGFQLELVAEALDRGGFDPAVGPAPCSTRSPKP